MKVKVTSTGITQKGTSSHLINTRYLPTVTTISGEAPSVTRISRVPNKPMPTIISLQKPAHGMSVVVAAMDKCQRRDSLVESTEHRERNDADLPRDSKASMQDAPDDRVSSARVGACYTNTSSSLSGKTATVVSKSKVQNVISKTKPTTQAIRIAVQSKKLPAKQGQSAVVINAIHRKQVITKKEPVTSTTTTKEVKQVFVKHTTLANPQPVAFNRKQCKQSQSLKPSNIKKTVLLQEASKPLLTAVASNIGTKRKAETQLHKVTPKTSKLIDQVSNKDDDVLSTSILLDTNPSFKIDTKSTNTNSKEKGKSTEYSSSGTVQIAGEPRSTDISTSKIVSKTPKSNNKGKGQGKSNCSSSAVVYTQDPEFETVDGKTAPNTPAPKTTSTEELTRYKKSKRQRKTWRITTSAKQANSLMLFYGGPSFVAMSSAGVEKKVSVPLSKPDKDCIKEIANSAVTGEIKDLLHAFGDSSEPLESTVRIMEEVLFHELTGFIRVCEQKANIRCGKGLEIVDAVLALKRNIPRMDRMYKHFGFKDIYNRKVVATLPAETGTVKTKLVTKKIRWIIEEFKLIDLFHLLPIGLEEIENSLQGIEDAKLEEAVRSSPEMLKFYQYAKTRSLSFARKLSTVNIRKSISTSCRILAKMTETFGAVLDFFILDFMAELVDSAFDIRKERLVECSETRVANPDTCMSAPFFLKKRKDDRCNQVSEILVRASEIEAIRLKKDQKKSGERRWTDTTVSKPLVILRPAYIREAYMRFHTDSIRPALSFAVQVGMHPTFL